MTETNVDYMVDDAMRRVGGPRSPWGEPWRVRIRIIEDATGGDEAGLHMERRAHATEGTTTRSMYDPEGARRIDGRWTPTEEARRSIEKLLMDAGALERRDHALRDHLGNGIDESPSAVTSDRWHMHQPPPWAYAMDRLTRLMCESIGWSGREMTTVAGSSFDAEGRAAAWSRNGLEMTMRSVRRSAADQVDYQGTVKGMVVQSTVTIRRPGIPVIVYGPHGDDQMLEIRERSRIPETILQGMIGRDVSELIALPIRGDSGMRIIEIQTGGTGLGIGLARKLEPVEAAPAGVDTSWLADYCEGSR